MKLIDLEPRFLRHEDVKTSAFVDTIDTADGIIFLCPKCFAATGNRLGVHSVICWRPRVPLDVSPGPGRWEFQGTGYTDLTLVAGSSSVLLTSGCQAHFYVQGGIIVPA